MHTLFKHNLTISTLGSGSRGNATYIGDGRAGVLIDCGLSTRQILKRLEHIGHGDSPIDAVLITHEHSDHVGSARILERALLKRTGRSIPFFMTVGTAKNLPEQCRPANIRPVSGGRPFRLGSWLIEPTSISHDTAEPVAYSVDAGGTRVGVLTDLGEGCRRVQQQLATLDVAVLEFNHDLEMLLDGAYPWRLKERVRGRYGHLSNQQAADLLALHASSRLKNVILGHLSQDNNTIDRAFLSCERALHRAGRKDVQIHVAAQDTPLAPVTIPTIGEKHSVGREFTHSPTARMNAQPSLFPDL
jgi:phosphoribosyl 1,2-cyclic phosphodiesterase